ncbi:uncharacterized protein IL334_003884 [Kwoniella shivajii]|uniref:Uncharacterized protein n=1 Tax=Kwoniella shivajii TaxID=564305 RepID=A0ABZ1D0N3_9TREE|nr:hypothetical protein IL334_003884 [Kwoniella shivajii]
MPSSKVPTYYLPPPHSRPMTSSTTTSISAKASSSTSILPKRPTIPNVYLFKDILSALGESSSEPEHEPKYVHEDKAEDIPHIARETLAVDNELHRLKRSISERNLSNNRNTQHDIQSIEKLLHQHKLEKMEFDRTKIELSKEKDLNTRLMRDMEKMKMKFQDRLEESQKANKKALKILMGLQRDEFISWSKELIPHLQQIDSGIKMRIKNWEKTARKGGDMTTREKRDSSPDSAINVMDRNRKKDGRRSPGKSIGTRSVRLVVARDAEAHSHATKCKSSKSGSIKIVKLIDNIVVRAIFKPE